MPAWPMVTNNNGFSASARRTSRLQSPGEAQVQGTLPKRKAPDSTPSTFWPNARALSSLLDLSLSLSLFLLFNPLSLSQPRSPQGAHHHESSGAELRC